MRYQELIDRYSDPWPEFEAR